ncbi:MAG: MBL fold metallo-hydrolase, partial [Deltaproteobacteria bacterium]|nr:MBL fold metallo-hydrolase [Deltaproteobacteria bacterium]
MNLQEVDRVEILTLQDNYVDLVARDDNEIVKRAVPYKEQRFEISVSAEHGFSALVTVFLGDRARSVLFDFGFSENGAAQNAKALNLDLTSVEALVLSHGHMDHIGGLLALVELTGKKGLDLFLHPAAFRQPRYMKTVAGINVILPSLSRHQIQTSGIMIREAKAPTTFLDGQLLFLGEVPRKTEFEKGAPYFFHEEEGQEHLDLLEDDTALVANIRGRGLMV